MISYYIYLYIYFLYIHVQVVSQSHATLNTATLLTSLAMVVITILWYVQLQFIKILLPSNRHIT